MAELLTQSSLLEDNSHPFHEEDNLIIPTQQQSPQVSLSLAASSDIVRSLFGQAVGSSWGDFFCSRNRIRGRLFATSQAVLFYSNLLGFEQRQLLQYEDITEMELYRSTSIRIATVEFESYIFKSFHHRKHVLQLLKGLKVLADQQRDQWIVQDPIQGRNEGVPLVSSPSLGVIPTPSTCTFAPSPSPPMPSNRRRAVSDSVLRFPQIASHPHAVATEQHAETAESVSGEDSFMEESDFVLKDAWNEAQKPRNPPLQQIGIESLSLSCSLNVFFQQFLADNAPFSLDRYQRDYIKDREVNATKWKSGENDVYTRTITFTHPIKNSLGLGPSSAHTTRRQKLRRFRDYGILLENTTTIEGIPSADAFHVQDHWIIQADGDFRVNLRVRHDTRFTKLALFKAIIEKNVRKETKDWFDGYISMLQAALMEEKSTTESVAASVISMGHRDDQTLLALNTIHNTLVRYAVAMFVLLSAMALLLSLQLVSMRETVVLLRDHQVAISSALLSSNLQSAMPPDGSAPIETIYKASLAN